MTLDKDSFVVAIGCVVVILLQCIVAPAFAGISAQPNFLLAFAIALAIVRPTKGNVVLPFVLGLLFDLMGEGPVGAMAFLCLLSCFMAAQAFKVLDNNSVFMPLFVLVATALLVELCYAALMLVFGLDANFIDAFLYRALPCALFDSIAGIIAYALLSHFLEPAPQDFGLNMPTLR